MQATDCNPLIGFDEYIRGCKVLHLLSHLSYLSISRKWKALDIAFATAQ